MVYWRLWLHIVLQHGDIDNLRSHVVICSLIHIILAVILAFALSVLIPAFPAFRASPTASPPPAVVELPFRDDGVECLFPISRLDPVEENLERLIYGQDFAGAQLREVCPDRKPGGADLLFLGLFETEVLTHSASSVRFPILVGSLASLGCQDAK